MVFEKIKEIILEQFVIEGDITLETSFQDDLNADSLDVVELIMAIEDEFDLEVEDEELEDVRTVGDVVKHIEEIQNFD